MKINDGIDAGRWLRRAVEVAKEKAAMEKANDKLRWKRRYIGPLLRHGISSAPLGAFTPPTCRTCGTVALVRREPDGACGDPECCPQTDHVALVCPNMDCETATETMPWS